MTEQERHQKIAVALAKTAIEVDTLLTHLQDVLAEAKSLLKRARQLATLAEEFEAGKYLQEGDKPSS